MRLRIAFHGSYSTLVEPPRKSRTVHAPPPVGPGVVNRFDTVILFEDEDVVWEWTNTPEGTRFVSGYTIFPARRRLGPEARDVNQPRTLSG